MSETLPGLRRSTVNVLATWLLQAGTLLFALISVPLVTRRFGLEGLGVWLLVQQLASHLQLLELGLASSLGRFLSRDHALQNSGAYTSHASSAVAILLIMGGLLLLLAVPLGQFFPHVFELPQEMTSDAVWMLAIAIAATGLALPLRSGIGILLSQHRFALQSGSEGFALVLRTILVVSVCTLLDQHALVALSLAVFVPNLIGALMVFIAATRIAPYEVFSFRFVSAKPMRELLDISFAAMVVTLAAVLLRQGGPMMAGYSLGVASVPLVALPVMIVVSMGPFLGIANKLIAPVASQLDALNRPEELHAAYLTAAQYMLAAGLFLFAAMALLMPYLLPLWLGRGVLEPHHAHIIYVNLLFVFAGYCIAIPAFLARAVLISVGKHRVAVRGELISGLAGLAIGWLLMDTFGLGATGMALGIASAYLLRAVGTLVRQLALYFDIPLACLYGQVWRTPLLSALPLPLAFLPATFGSQDAVVMVLFAVPAFGLWAYLFLRWVMPEIHREKIIYTLRLRAGKKR